MIDPTGSNGEKAVAFHLAPIALAFLISVLAIHGLLDQVNQDAVSNFVSDETLGTTQTRDSSASDTLSHVFTDEILHWKPEIEGWAAEYALDPNLIAVVMQIESCGHPDIASSAGALGLFQVMPFHFVEGENPLEPNVNAHRGLHYLRRALELAQGNVTLAMAGYNGGHSVIEWDSNVWPLETNRYVYWGSGIYADIKQGFAESPRLAEWLAAGGASLCSRASYALNS